MATIIKIVDDSPGPLTPAQVARLTGRTPKQVTQWARAGKLRCFRTPGGHRRYTVSDVEAFLNRGNR